MTHKYDTCEIDCSFYDVCYGKLAYCPKRIVEKHISDLSEREQYVVNMRCGFNDNQQHSFAEIGRNLGLSGARVSQIYKQAICHRYKDYLGIPEHIVMCGKKTRIMRYTTAECLLPISKQLCQVLSYIIL